MLVTLARQVQNQPLAPIASTIVEVLPPLHLLGLDNRDDLIQGNQPVNDLSIRLLASHLADAKCHHFDELPASDQ